MVGGTDRPAISDEQVKRFKKVDSVVFDAFLKLLGLTMVGCAVFFWAAILGVTGEDLSALYERNAYNAYSLVVVSVLTPPVAIGLWLGMRWGLLLWGILSVSLLSTHFLFKPLSIDLYIYASTLAALLTFYCVGLIVRLWLKRFQGEV